MQQRLMSERCSRGCFLRGTRLALDETRGFSHDPSIVPQRYLLDEIGKLPSNSFARTAPLNIPLVYYASDVLRLEGTDLRSRPLAEGPGLLAKLVRKAPVLRRVTG